MLRVSDCEVCEALTKGDDHGVFRTDFWNVVLAPDQYYLGRVYVTALDHVPDLPNLSQAAWLDLHAVMQKYTALVERVFKAKHVTWAALMNHAYRAEDPKPHVHWHVRPRYSEPVQFGSYTFTDPEYGNHHQREETRRLPEETMAAIADYLRIHLSAV